MNEQATPSKETLGFQAEVKQLLNLMIHSLYSNKEIFLRELISNASDAADKLRFEALTDKALMESDSELKIRVAFDPKTKTITVSDNGIGMSREEVVANIGTIAKSGTREFLSKLTGDQQKDANLIGQFGVGFYSSFVVADKVTVTTRRAGAPASAGVRWESDGGGEYTLEAVEKAARGTAVTLHLREGEDELANNMRLQTIIRKYSDHITLPIVMKEEEWDKDNSVYRTTEKDQTINQASALWARAKNDITEEQYHEFYKHVSHDWEAPLAYSHNKVEGRKEFTQLLYIPARAPFDLWDREHRRGIKLYVRRVFIMDDAEQLLPVYLRFVRGVIDSADLPLNVSREILQESKDIEAMRGANVKRVLSMIEDLAENNADKFKTFWKEFGRVIKEGVVEDYGNRERIAKVLRFASTHTDTDAQEVALADYVKRMKPEQEKIYYVTAETFASAKNSPHLEVFRKKGVEVLLMCDRVDEWVAQHLTEFDGKKLQSVAKGRLELGKLEDEAEKKAQETAEGDAKALIERIKKSLGEGVKDVRVTLRLTDSPACLVADEHDMGANFQRLLKQAGQNAPASKPILEINPTHPLVERLKAEADDARFGDLSKVIFDQALLAEGGQLEDPAGFVKRLNQLMLALGK
jgi:molecular chaperone HtpG